MNTEAVEDYLHEIIIEVLEFNDQSTIDYVQALFDYKAQTIVAISRLPDSDIKIELLVMITELERKLLDFGNILTGELFDDSADQGEHDVVPELTDLEAAQTAEALRLTFEAQTITCSPLSSHYMRRIPVITADIAMESEMCVICQETFKKDELVRILLCIHQYHNNCFEQYCASADSCPICKVDIRKSLSDNDTALNNLVAGSSNT